MFKRRVNVLAVVFLGAILGETTWSLAQQGKTKELTAQDYIEIQQLYARYNFAIDVNDAENMTAAFTDDGEFYNGSRVNGIGRDGILAFMHNRKLDMRRHWNTNLTITSTPGGVKGAVYLLLVDVGKQPPVILGAAKYDDTLVKTPKGWRFKKRVVNNEGPPGAGSPQ
jgi:hypothetical protein